MDLVGFMLLLFPAFSESQPTSHCALRDTDCPSWPGMGTERVGYHSCELQEEPHHVLEQESDSRGPL